MCVGQMQLLQDLYTENYKALLREIKEDLNKRRDILGSWVRRLNTVKMLIFPKRMYRFSAIPTQILADISQFQNAYENAKDLRHKKKNFEKKQ